MFVIYTTTQSASFTVCRLNIKSEQWPDFGCEGIKVQRAHQPTSQCQGKLSKTASQFYFNVAYQQQSQYFVVHTVAVLAKLTTHRLFCISYSSFYSVPKKQGLLISGNMPPKSNKQAKAADKAKEKAKQKVVEDKTFGLKNKNKSKKVQQYIQNMEKSGQNSSKIQRMQTAEQQQKNKKKEEQERKKELDEMLAMSIQQPKVPTGVDPKSIVCELFKHKVCTKGYKCKFSHDLNVAMKSAKIDLYTDRRDGEEEGMEDWDQETLEKAVKQKHGQEKQPKTDIICKFFLDAVEKKQYGWFWKCPNGQSCIYRHALPPGYVLKSQMTALLEDEKSKAVDVSEQIEDERRKVQAKTRITEAVFAEWHDKKTKEKKEKERKADEDRRAKGILNGREMFMMEGFEAMDDTGAADDYDREDDDDALIKKMEEETKQRWAQAEAEGGYDVEKEEDANGKCIPPSNANNASSSSHAEQLTAELEEELFGGDDLDIDELDEIENQLKQSQIQQKS
eukprot:TRINITY_DN20601_c0_g1_i1.p1 TRINITY_DN20601_c0_g1~~TRINITY_DN20601_c0_g1_i1.p1  ORF type:complete len:585 (+),score=131.03 TRINITY_DN20601_c0_g1_i1:238-1755(+)